jgi:hypothetical protein
MPYDSRASIGFVVLRVASSIRGTRCQLPFHSDNSTKEKRMRRICIVACFTLLAVAPLLVPATDKDRLSIERFLHWEYVSSPAVSPDSTRQVSTPTAKLAAGNRENARAGHKRPGSESKIMKNDEIRVRHTEHGPDVQDLDNPVWKQAGTVNIDSYWSGEKAPETRQAKAQLLWSVDALYVRFEGNQGEPLVVSASPRVDVKTLGLWDRDVFEIFVGPKPAEPERYFEFEAAPTGEWVDLGIRQLTDRRETDTEVHSGVTTAARIKDGKITVAMRIPWSGFGFVPKKGDRLRSNLFRCIGAGEQRGYLAWRPTNTPQPNFHVPSAFGWLLFE